MSELTHLDDAGNARMVDVAGKAETARTATAEAHVLLAPATLELLRAGAVPKGDALAVCRIAGIMAAKRTPDLIPLCHPLPVKSVAVDAAVRDDRVTITATVGTFGRTGVEMEALTAVTVGALALYDMVKAVDRAAVISDVRLRHKAGGKSGEFRRGDR